MGIHLSSIAQINSIVPGLTGIRYFVYLINYYNIDDTVIDELLASVPAMDAKFSKLGNIVSVSSVRNLDFANEAISWQNCFGLEADQVCPAILICTLPPIYFIPRLLTKGADGEDEAEQDVPWILLSLKDRGRNIGELMQIIERIVEEAAMGTDISSFDPKRILRTIDNRPVINAEAAAAGSSLPREDIFKRLGDA
jgi:hypothetical protein